MGVYQRGDVLWIRFRDASGDWRRVSTGCKVGDEGEAHRVLAEVERRIAAEAAAPKPASSSPTVAEYAERWLADRETETVDDDRGRIENRIIPALGSVPIGELRPKQIRDFVVKLSKTKKLGNRRSDGSRVPTEELIAPRTVRHVYGTLRAMLNHAVAEEVIPTNPCALEKGELPAKKDKDPTWRRTAVFTRDEVQTLLSAPIDHVPEDRHVLYAIMFVGAMRFGEAAALTWRDYDATATPLGKLVVEKSYSTKSRRVKATKTDNPREMPVHPTLAKILAAWKLGGWERLTGRPPKPEDLIVPSRRGSPRNVNHGLRRFHEDLERVGLRERRQHDARRTFISIARADGARPDILRWATHGPTGDITDVYTTLPWATLCEEVAKVRVELLEGKLVAMPLPVAVGAGIVHTESTGAEAAVLSSGSWRSGRDLNAPTPTLSDSRESHRASNGAAVTQIGRRPATPSVVHSAQRDGIGDALAAAETRWRTDGDTRALRRELLRLLADLDG